MKECKVTVEQKGAFWLLRWNGKLIYKSKDETKVRNKAKVYEHYAEALNERSEGEQEVVDNGTK
jgi:hypothetical protein